MAIGRILISGMLSAVFVGVTGCRTSHGCCQKNQNPQCCPPSPAFTGGPVSAPPPPATQSFSVGPTCALPLQ
jgi:hypothetical protein